VASDRLASAMTQLAVHLDEVSRIARFEPALLALRVERVSRWSIGLQVDHILKVLEAGQRLLAEENPTLPRGMNVAGRFALATGWVPRGVGKSPKGVLPAEQSGAELAGRSSELRKVYCERPLPAHVLENPRPVFKHPYFGGLSAAQGLRFLGIHTHHHMKIVADIRRAG
jgi:hypothetical protein